MARLLMWFKKRKMYMRFLLSLIAILVVSSLMFTFLYTGFFAMRYSEKVIGRNADMFEKIARYTDDTILQLQNTALLLQAEPRISKVYIGENMWAWPQITQKLRAYYSMNRSLHDIFYIHRDLPYIYSSYGVCNPRYMLEYDRQAMDSIYEIQVARGGSVLQSGHVALASSSSKDILEFVAPSPQDEGIFVFQIVAEQFMPSLSYDADAYVLLQDGAGNILYNPGISEGFFERDEGEETQWVGGFEKRIVDNEDYLLFTVRLENADASLIFLVPYASLMYEIDEMNKAFVILSLSLAAFCVVLTILLANRNYLPIKRMTGLLDELTADIPEYLNETEAASYALRSLYSKSIRLEEQNAQSAREKLLLRMMMRDGDKGSGLQQEAERLGMHITERQCVVFLFSPAETVAAEIFYAAERKNIDWLGNQTSLYHMEYVQGTSAFFLALVDQENYDSFIMALDDVRLRLEDEYKCGFTYCVGAVQSGYSGVYLSFVQARKAALRSTVRYTSGVYLYRDLPVAQGHEYDYPQVEIEGLYTAIINRNPARIEFLSGVLTDMAETGSHSHFHDMRLYYDITNAMLRAVRELERLGGGEWAGLAGKADIPLQTYEEFCGCIKQLTSGIVAVIRDKDGDGTDLLNRIAAYIAENLSDPDLCVNSVGHHMGISASYVSQLFKQQTGMNLSTYISERRLERVRMLLLSTDMPIAQIAQEMGYSQTSSFIRRFKSIEGFTPMEYRQRNGGE